MVKVSFEEVVEMLEELKYKRIMEVGEGFYTAINPYNEPREFAQLPEGNNVMLISKRNLLENMEEGKDFQTFEVEFIDDDSKYKIFIRDFLVGKDIEKFMPSDVPKEYTNINYK